MRKIIILFLIPFLLFSSGCIEENTFQIADEPDISPTPTVSAPSSATPGITETEDKYTPAPAVTTVPKDGLNLSAHFIDVGQGDSILIQFAGKNILVDGGERNMGLRVSSYLRNQGITEIDLMVATHPHSDHIGGLITILSDFKVKEVMDSGQVHTSKTYENFLTLIDQKNIPYRAAERGQTIDLDPYIKIEVLSPPPPSSRLKDLNENSIVLKITYDQVTFLLMGDAGFDAEDFISSDNIDSDILKVGHHGSKYATGTAFLKKVTPAVSVIQSGEGNSYGHPALETISRLQNTGSEIYRTDTHGSIVITTDGRSYSVMTQRQPDQTVIATTPTLAAELYMGYSVPIWNNDAEVKII